MPFIRIGPVLSRSSHCFFQLHSGYIRNSRRLARAFRDGFSLRTYSSSTQPNRPWAQIGKGTEVIQQDLGSTFFQLHGRGGFIGLSNLSIYHKQITVSDPFHYPVIPQPPSPTLTNSSASQNSEHHHHKPHLPKIPPVLIPILPPASHKSSEQTEATFGRGGYLLKGRIAYTAFVACIRFLLLLYYDDPSLEIIRARTVTGRLKKTDLDDEYPKSTTVWRRERKDDVPIPVGKQENVKLVLRWMFEGTPRHKLLYAKLLNPLTSPQPSIYEGVFVYTFEGQQGLVINHRLESMSPTPWVPKVCRWWLDRKAKARQQTQEERDRGGNGLPQLNSGKRPVL